MVNCDKGDNGCNGGRLDTEWNFIMKTGIATDACFPYKNGDRPSTHYSCRTKCNDGSTAKLYKAVSGSAVVLTDA